MREKTLSSTMRTLRRKNRLGVTSGQAHGTLRWPRPKRHSGKNTVPTRMAPTLQTLSDRYRLHRLGNARLPVGGRHRLVHADPSGRWGGVHHCAQRMGGSGVGRYERARRPLGEADRWGRRGWLSTQDRRGCFLPSKKMGNQLCLHVDKQMLFARNPFKAVKISCRISPIYASGGVRPSVSANQMASCLPGNNSDSRRFARLIGLGQIYVLKFYRLHKFVELAGCIRFCGPVQSRSTVTSRCRPSSCTDDIVGVRRVSSPPPAAHRETTAGADSGGCSSVRANPLCHALSQW